jgi:pimeloyl-ACP methyl ester carboxylesterase
MAELPRPDRVLDVRTGFGVVRVHRFDGGAPGRAPLVLLPGRASASPMWKANLPSLLRHAPVYLLDLLGEPGRSVQDTPITDADDQARWLHETLAALPEERVDLLGVSISGWTAVNLATRRPEKIRSLMLLDPVLVFAPLTAAAVWRSIPAGIRLLPTRLREGFTSWTANGAPVSGVPVARMIAAGMHAYAPALPAPRRMAEEELARLDVPVLVLVAGRSRMHDPHRVAGTARRVLRHGHVVVYEGASHAVNGECPDRITADVAALRETLP